MGTLNELKGIELAWQTQFKGELVFLLVWGINFRSLWGDIQSIMRLHECFLINSQHYKNQLLSVQAMDQQNQQKVIVYCTLSKH